MSYLSGSNNGGAPGAAEWGLITGTLSDQTDLQTALDGKANLDGGFLIQAENPQPTFVKSVYVARSAVVTGTRDGSLDYPFETVQDAIDFFGDPVDLADYSIQVEITILDKSSYNENLVFTTRQYYIDMSGGSSINTNTTWSINNALRFGSGASPRIEIYANSRGAGTNLVGNFTATLTGTAVSNVTLRLTNVLLFGNVLIADGTNGGPSVTTGASSAFVLTSSTVVGTFLGRNVGLGLADNAAITGNIEAQALLAVAQGVLQGTSIKMYGTSTVTRDIITLQLLSSGGVTWENVNVEPRWTTDQFTLSQFTLLATVITNKIRFNVNVYAQATNDTATGASRQSYHDSASPAANDIILTDSSFGRDSANNKQEYARTEVVIEDATTTAEDAVVKLYNVIAGAMTELVRYGSQGGVNLFNILGGLQCDSIVNDTGLAAGTYTPTLTNTTNIDASTPRQATYLRVGNTVTVAGQLDIDPTAAAATLLGISLPIASNFGTAFQAGGTASATGIAGMCGGIEADATNDRVSLKFIASDVTNQTMAYQFTYQII